MSSSPPYFDLLFDRLQEQDPSTLLAFGRHLHWGYWDDPDSADGSADDYAAAAERLCRHICAAAGIRAGAAVLDVGCGFGGTIASLNERCSNVDLVGVNIDQRQLERASRHVKACGGNRVRFVKADACDLPFDAESFDAVLAVECIFHFPDRGDFFRHAGRLLRTGGSLALSDFVPQERVLPYLEMTWNEFDPLGNRAARQSFGHIDFHCTMSRYRELAASVGLELTAEEDVTANTMPTYPFLRASMKTWKDAELAAAFDSTTARVEKAVRKGFVQYKILVFRKP